jgi:hypothetical protein
VGEPILSQQNLASHNQKMNPVTHREQQNQDPIRPAKKRAGASTDMVPKRQAKPLTDVRNNYEAQQYDISPQRKLPQQYQQQSPLGGAKNSYNSAVRQPGPSVSHSLEIQNFRGPQQPQQRMPPQMHNAQSMQGLGQYQRESYP